MARPLLSLCIPTFNRADWLKACLDSCLAQAQALPEGLVEVVVCDNASPDGTQALLTRYAAEFPVLRAHRNPDNIGSVNFDRVVEHARGEYAWLLGDDDALLPGALALVADLIQETRRDFYLPHVVMDSMDPEVRRMAWFQDLPRLDWNLTDPDEFLEYMQCGCSASAVFSFISVLIFKRDPWLAALAARPASFTHSPWPQVATALEYLKDHGRLRVIPEALVNYHCSTGSWGEGVWDRAMQDLRGLIQIADHFFPGHPDLYAGFLGNLRKNHGDGWIAHHRISAPQAEAWEESRTLLLKAGFDPLKVAAVGLGERLRSMNLLPHPGLAAGDLILADLGFVARGARRALVLGGSGPGPDLHRFLTALAGQSCAEILVLGSSAEPGPGFPEPGRCAYQQVELARFASEVGYQEETGDALRAFAPDLLVNLDPQRHPGWDLLAAAAGAVAGLAFQAPERAVAADVASWLDGQYTRVLTGSTEAMAAALGLAWPGPESASPGPDSSLASPREGPMKLNLGCGHDHLPGWVNVDQFPGSRPDVVHDLERFPWPFADHCAGEVLLKHVLEHLGRDSDTFLKIIQELYRVCAPGALVRIVVPHPRHQDFLQDPSHVRPVLPEMFQHFSLAVNEEWLRLGLPGTPLAMYLGLDFEVQSATSQLDPRWDAEYRSGRLTRAQLDQAMRDLNNVVQATEVVLRAVKPLRGFQGPGAPGTPLPVAWEGSQFVYHSLAHVNRQLCLGLLASGQVELSLIPYENDQFLGTDFPAFSPLAPRVNRPLAAPAAVHVRHQWPPSFEPPAQGAWVMIQPWEFGGVPQAWVAPMRDLVDEVWVPSSWVKDCYVKSGIPEAQVVVIPNGVDPAVFGPEGPRLPLRTRKQCKFLFVGGTIYRKGFDVLLEAYQKAFRASDDVCLVIKGQGGGVYGGGDLLQALERIRSLDPSAPEIEYRVDNLDEAAMAALYRSCDALVLPYRGEGFGLPIAEAMASGLPVIVTGRGAAMDFVREDWAYLIPSQPRSVKTVDQCEPSRAGFWLEEPDGEALVRLLRLAYGDPAQRQDKGRRARAYAVAELGWAKPVALALARCRALAARQPRRLGQAAAEPIEKSEAFLYEPDWSQAEWVELLLSYLTAFRPGEPVALVFAWSAAGGPSLEVCQGQVLELIQRSGWEQFPDLVLVDKPEELAEVLGGYTKVQAVPSGRGAVAGLAGPYGDRLARARTQLAGG